MRPSSSPVSIFAAFLVSSVLVLGACQSTSKKENSQNSEADENRPLVDEKYSLTADRKQFEELRQNIPEEKRRENDELALFQGLFADPKKSPSQIREKFDSLLRKKREAFQKDLTKTRETYVKEERKRRDEFNKDQEKQRQEFRSGKKTREQTKEFFDELDLKRKEFQSTEREKRDEFEANIRDQRKNFEDYAREKSNEFHQELRSYQKKFEAQK